MAEQRSPSPSPEPTRPASYQDRFKQHLPNPTLISPRDVIQLPNQCLHAYRSFVRQNASQISSIESGLRSLTYILPGRFHESPLTSESLYTGLTLLTAWHTNILSPSNSQVPGRRLSPQHRYERWCRATGGKLYVQAVTLLRTLQYTQLLCEMFAKRAGEKVRWRMVVVLELVKAICRLVIMRVTGNRPVMGSSVGAENQERIVSDEEPKSENPSEPHPETNVNAIPTANGHVPNGHIHSEHLDASTTSTSEYIMPRTGLRLPTSLPTPPSSSSASSPTESVHDYLSNRTLTSDDLKSPARLVHPLSTTRAQLAEFLWIIRPVIYALALQRYATARNQNDLNSQSLDRNSWKRSWTPWLLGIGLELLSRRLSKQSIRSSVPGGMKGLSVLEREELQRRGGWGGGSLWWWALRGGFYENVTRDIVKGVAGKLKGKMLLDMLGVVVEDYDWLWDEWYFATATA